VVPAGIRCAVVFWGASGFLFNRRFALGWHALDDPANHGLAFGVFETNGWHNVAALILGGLAVAFSRSPKARVAAAVLGAVYAVITIQVAVADPVVIASNVADNVLHLILALGGLVAALVSPPGGDRRA